MRFYLPAEAAEVTEAAALAAAKAGPDWSCGYCGADNRAGAAHCTQCGAGKDGSAPRPVIEHRAAPPPSPGPQALAPKKRGGRMGCGIVALVLATFVGLQSWCSRPRAVELTPVGYAWERTVEVQALRPVEEEGWEGEIPGNARIVSSRRELYRTDRVEVGSRRETRTVTERVQVGTERVKTGSRDLGNGYFEDIYEDRPVYRDQRRQVVETVPVYEERKVWKNRVRYVITKWVTVRTERASGSNPRAEWPAERLGPGEQIGARTETYQVQLRDAKGRTFTYKIPSENDFRRLEPGRPVTGEIAGKEIKRLMLDGR